MSPNILIFLYIVIFQLKFSLRSLQELIYLFEGLFKSIIVVVSFVGGKVCEDSGKILLYVLCYFMSCIIRWVPLCPSNTPNKALPSPRSGQRRERSSIEDRHHCIYVEQNDISFVFPSFVCLVVYGAVGPIKLMNYIKMCLK